MDNTFQKGTVKRELARFEVLDYNLAKIITESLTEKGFDVEVKAIKNNAEYFIGERITVFKNEKMV